MSVDPTTKSEKSGSPLAKAKRALATKSQAVLLLVAMIGVTWMGYVVPRAKINVDDAALLVESLEKEFKEEANDATQEGKFQYDSIEVRGDAFSQYIVIRNPAISLVSRTGDRQGLSLSTDYAILKPTNGFNPKDKKQELKLIFEKPLVITRGGYYVSLIPKEALGLDINYVLEDLRMGIDLPRNTTFVLKLGGVPPYDVSPAWREYQVEFKDDVFDDGGYISGGCDFNVSGKFSKTEDREFVSCFVRMDSLSLVSVQDSIKLDNFDMDFISGVENGKTYKVYNLLLEDLFWKEDWKEITLTKFYADVNETTNTSSDYPREVTVDISAEGEDAGTALELKKSRLNFMQREELPYGELSLYVTNPWDWVGNMERINLIPKEIGDFAVEAIERAGKRLTSEAAGDLNAYDIKLTRKPGGAFMVGKLTIEELVATLLPDMLPGMTWNPQQKAKPVTPTPARKEPKPAE